MPASGDLTQLLKRAAADNGLELSGIAPIADFPEFRRFEEWIAEGWGGEMRYLEARSPEGELKRVAVDRVFPWVRSMIVCAINYNTADPKSDPPDGSGWISRYAWSNRDYHKILTGRLKRLEERLHQIANPIQTRSYVDTGPLIERVYAQYAGIGWVGKNTCIINQRLGSWLFLGVVLTSITLDGDSSASPDSPTLAGDLPAPDRCGTCTRCLDACPTSAFLGPRRLDATRCISYLTIEKRGTIPEDLCGQMGRHVFGCDICQEVCPWNRKAPISTSPELQPRAGLVNPGLAWLATMDENEFQETFRASPIKRAKLTGLRRNAVIAIGNSRDPGFVPLLRKLTNDADAVVAEHARRALSRLQK